MAAALCSSMRHPPVIQSMKNKPSKQSYLGPLNNFSQKRPLKNYNIWRQVKLMTGRFSIYSSQFLIIHRTATHPSLLSNLLFSLVLKQAHSYDSLTETLMRVFNMAVTTKDLPLMTVLQRLHQSCVLPTSAHLCKRNLTFVSGIME